jgi:hypothetical protein
MLILRQQLLLAGMRLHLVILPIKDKFWLDGCLRVACMKVYRMQWLESSVTEGKLLPAKTSVI